MLWWIWVVAGLVLVVLELLTPGLFLLFFGAAAIVVGVAAGAGLAMPLWAELLAFSVLSVVSLLVFRGPLLRRMKSRPEDPP
ncbi:MAG TPA: NfeD family protein, partial [Myxococcota bacterium]|nr:NfeD family protein [Myxococcota bacterium]